MLSTVASFSTSTPGILNTTKGVSFSLPILNAGGEDADTLIVTKLQLGSAERLSPEGLPLFVGVIGAGNAVPVSALFDSTHLVVGHTYLITIGGTYKVGSSTLAFTVNRPIVIPAVVPPPISLLNANVSVTAGPPKWSYTICNEELASSPNSINTFSLDVAVPFTVTSTPPGWTVSTDNKSHVLWYAAASSRIAPGFCLSGFAIQGASGHSESTGFILTSWNTSTNKAGTVAIGAALTPFRLG